MKKEKTYVFDEIFQEKQKNKEIFEKVVKNMVDNTLNGYNSTLLAYGVTGTGKTHTVFGDIYKESNREKGVSTYSIEYLFSQISQIEDYSFNVKLSYLEIYNEQVIDLLTDQSQPLLIIEDQIKGVIVPDLKEYVVTSSKELMNIVIEGNNRRTMGATGKS
jgi:kinesin family protein 18/19